MRIKRTIGLSAAALVILAPLAACSSGGEAGDESRTLSVSLPNHAWTNVIEGQIDAFEEESGITVNLTTFGEDQLSDQYNVKLNTGSTDFDMMMYRPLQDGRLFVQNGWLAPIDDYIASAGDEWNWADFQAGPVDAVTQDDSVYGVPLIVEREVLYYNKELLDAAGVEVPTTLEQLEQAAAAVHDPDNGIYGFISRGQRAASVTQFSSYLYSFGGDFDDGENATLNTPEAIEAYKFYSRMLNLYGPPGTTEMNWLQAMPVFAQGKVAFYTDADSLYTNLEDPSTSAVVDSFGIAQFPAGPAGAHPYNIPAWALGINQFSENKDLAWEFIEWATSPEMTLALQQQGQTLARTSVWDSDEGVAGFPADLVEAIRFSTQEGVGIGHDRPQVVRVSEARDIVGLPIVVGIDGGDVEAAVEQAQVDYQAFLDQANGE